MWRKNGIIDTISEASKTLFDGGPGLSFIVPPKIGDILKKEERWLIFSLKTDYLADVVEHITAAFFVEETLAVTSLAKWLAGETSTENIVLRDRCKINFGNIALNSWRFREVLPV